MQIDREKHTQRTEMKSMIASTENMKHDIYVRFTEAINRRLNSKNSSDFSLPNSFLAHQHEIPDAVIAAASAEVLNLNFNDTLNGRTFSHAFLSKIPISFARRHSLIGLAEDGDAMQIAISDLAQWPQLQTLGKILKRRIIPLFVPKGEILQKINYAYQQQTGQADQVIEEMNSQSILHEIEHIGTGEDLLDVSTRAPVIKLVNLMLFEAIKQRASDVHVHPYEEQLIVRFRRDGVLHDAFTPPKGLQEEIISRIKVMGAMNIAERRLAQDGRATVEVGDRIVDLRISTIPTSFGERAVIRLLDKSVRLYALGELGMPDPVLNTMRNLIRMDHGIILVTGPTGSGKTTTLYAALQELNSKEMNILTLEDPIEYRLEGISQMQVANRKGMTFASGLRHVLRQDPDIIMVGEIRDSETANMAMQSAMTGHLVFSTLHTNDAASAVARLLDLGVEPYLVASSLLGVMAQRLLRLICPNCRQPFSPNREDLLRWNMTENDLDMSTSTQAWQGAGCQECMGTGHKERAGIFELLTITEPIRELILQREKSSTLKAHAVKNGMTTLRAGALEKAKQGSTTLEEVARVTGRDEF